MNAKRENLVLRANELVNTKANELLVTRVNETTEGFKMYARKQRTDKGKKRAPYGKRKQLVTV